MEVAGFDDGFHGLGEGRFDALLLILAEPGSVVLEILGVGGNLPHQRIQLPVGDGDEALRGAFGGTGIAVDLDKAVGEIDGGVVLDPGYVEVDPGGGVAGLVVADEGCQGGVLSGLGVGARLAKILVGP